MNNPAGDSLKLLRLVARLMVVALVCAPGLGCANYLGQLVAQSPNQGKWLIGSVESLPPAQGVLGIDDHFKVKVGPPEASLAVSIVEPHEGTCQGQPRGTVIVLHGLGAQGLWMLDTAHEFAADGYRAVLVDLRGHGGSTGNWITYGLRESRDLSQVMDELQHRRLLAGRIGVYGISFGAATAIHTAARDRRISAVVAVAPFNKLRDIAPHYLRTTAPGFGHLVTDKTFQEGVDVAGRRAAFNPDAADTSWAIRLSQAPVLLIHGSNDLIVPPSHSQQIHEASPRNTQLLIVNGAGHLSIWYDADRQVENATRQWFARHLQGP